MFLLSVHLPMTTSTIKCPLLKHHNDISIHLLILFFWLNNKRTRKPHQFLLGHICMRMIHIGTWLFQGECIRKRFSRFNFRRILYQRNPIHIIWHFKTMPMNGCCFRQAIMNSYFYCISFLSNQGRSRSTAIESPCFCFETIREFLSHWLCCQLVSFYAVVLFPGQ